MNPSSPPPDFKHNTGLLRAYRALFYSLSGLKLAFQYESAFRQELLLCAIALPWVLYFPFSVVEQLLMVGSLIGVLMAELINSAIEAVVDRVSTERHELSKRAKDIGSAAVFLALALAVLVWASLLGPQIWHLIQKEFFHA